MNAFSLSKNAIDTLWPWKFIFLLVLSFLWSSSNGQNLQLSISATNNAPDNCSARIISVSVTGGTGNYSYYWSSDPASNVNLGNSPSITVSPAVQTTYRAAVRDNSTNQYAETSILISPLLSGGFSLFVPNLFLKGELWRVLDGNQSTGALNAYRYELSIQDDPGNLVYASSGALTGSGSPGYEGGQISWNGRINGSGSYVPNGFYFYDLRLINCTSNQLFQGTIMFFDPANMVLEVYPNPADTFVEVVLALPKNIPELLREDLLGNCLIQLVYPEGELLQSVKVEESKTRLDVSKLPAGTYHVNVVWMGRKLTERLVIDR